MVRPEQLLTVHEVTFAYERAVPVINDVSAVLRAGRLYALIGPNAAGKSTLLKLMLGHLKPLRGALTLQGTALGSMDEKLRAALVSFVPQRGALGFAFTARHVVEMGRFAPGPNAEAVDRALAACDVLSIQDRVFVHLSGGQQQRVLIARAMAQAHGAGRIMLLDEPTSGMDLLHVHRTMSLLRQQSDRGLSVLVVLHDLNLAARYADEVWLMDGGRLVADGPWSQVMRPEVLEPVYRVSLQTVTAADSTRPMFFVLT